MNCGICKRVLNNGDDRGSLDFGGDCLACMIEEEREHASPEMFAQMIGVTVGEWAGNCHGISSAVAPLVGGVVRRGYFLGGVNPQSYFGKLGGVGQHSWVELPDGRVLDPTRHAIQGGDPIIWVGDADEYDIGGCKTQAPSGPCPYDETENGPTIVLDLTSTDYFRDLFGGQVECEEFIDDEEPVGATFILTTPQAIWLAHLPVKDREGDGILNRFFAAEAYEALVRAGQKALIPIDRLDWILPEHRA